MNSLILTYEGFQDQEVVYPYYRLLEEIEEGETVHLFANKTGRIFGILGCHVPANRLIEELTSRWGAEDGQGPKEDAAGEEGEEATVEVADETLPV